MSSKKTQKTAKANRTHILKIAFSDDEFDEFLSLIGLNPEIVTADRKGHSKHISEYARGILINKKPKKINLQLEFLTLLAGDISTLKQYLESHYEGNLSHFFDDISNSFARIRFNKKGDEIK